MRDKVVWTTPFEGKDVTQLLTGMPQNLPEEEALEMTDWDKWIDFWNRVDKALAKKYAKENKE